MKRKITAIGDSAGVILPKERLATLRVDKGDGLYALETPDGIKLTAFDPDLAAQVDAAEAILREDRAVLRKLAQRSSGSRERWRSPSTTGSWPNTAASPAFATSRGSNRLWRARSKSTPTETRSRTWRTLPQASLTASPAITRPWTATSARPTSAIACPSP